MSQTATTKLSNGRYEIRINGRVILAVKDPSSRRQKFPWGALEGEKYLGASRTLSAIEKKLINGWL